MPLPAGTQQRTVTFAGHLDPGDMSAEDGMVTIHRQESDRLDALLGRLPEDSRERLRALADPLPRRKMIAPPAFRSPRPGKLKRLPWMAEFAGLGIEDIIAREAPAAAEGFLPGRDLEVWLLPVVSFEFEILLTPAGEWPDVS